MNRLQKAGKRLAVNVDVTVGRNKVQMHVDLNKAYAVLLGLSYELDLPAFNDDLRKGRAFLSRMVDLSDYPPC